MTKLVRYFMPLLCICVFGACSNGSNNPNEVRFNGSVIVDPGFPAPDNGAIATIWQVTSGPGSDYSYVTAGGEISGQSFSVALPRSLPDEAINAGRFGVGIVVAYPEIGPPPSGVVNDLFSFFIPTGATEQYAIIYRTSTDQVDEIGWLNDFPADYSCGLSVEIVGDFDIFTPIGCDEMMLRIGNVQEFNLGGWT